MLSRGACGKTPVCSCVFAQEAQMPNSSSASRPVREEQVLAVR